MRSLKVFWSPLNWKDISWFLQLIGKIKQRYFSEANKEIELEFEGIEIISGNDNKKKE